MQQDRPQFDAKVVRQGTLHIGISLLMIEAWAFAVVAFAALPRSHGFWLFVLPYALLIPPSGVVREYWPGWKGIVAWFIGWVLASTLGFLARPTMADWLLHTVVLHH